MHTITGNNVNDLFVEGLWRLRVSGTEEESRNGLVLVLDSPAVSVYKKPMQRVLFSPARDANPFFHLMESLWMLAGRDDVGFVVHYNKNMRSFSDNGSSFNGAYGYRWRNHFGPNQIKSVIGMLRRNRTTRRAVIGMWDPNTDLAADSLDIPCNTHIYFRCREDRLDMTVCCRSNDLVWGAYGANAVHFSILHELIARGAGMEQGVMYQFSNNLHMYERHWHLLDLPISEPSPYDATCVIPLFFGVDYTQFLDDCQYLDERSFTSPFFNDIVKPAMFAWDQYRNGDIDKALAALQPMIPCDWKIAMIEWLIRRIP